MPKSATLVGIKSLRNYTTREAAELCNVSIRTINAWIKDGLPAMMQERPILVRGDALILFIKAQRKTRKTPVGPDQFYCLKCRAARIPAEGFVECETNGTRVKLTAICNICETIMHKPVSQSQVSLMARLFDLTVHETPQISKGTEAN